MIDGCKHKVYLIPGFRLDICPVINLKKTTVTY